MIDTKQFEIEVAELNYLQAKLLAAHKEWVDKISTLVNSGYTYQKLDTPKYIYPITKVTLCESISKKL